MTLFAGIELMSVAIALALDLYVAVELIAKTAVAASPAGTFLGLAMLCGTHWLGYPSECPNS